MMSNTDGKESFNAGGIKFQLIEAMRKWRILFNGLAKRTCNGVVSNLFEDKAFLYLEMHVILFFFRKLKSIYESISYGLPLAALTSSNASSVVNY